MHVFWVVNKCVFIALWSMKKAKAMWFDCLQVVRIYSTCFVYFIIVFLFVNNENNNIFKRNKTCCSCLHSLLKTSAKVVRILEQVKTLDYISGFYWSALQFSQKFASVFTRLWRHGKYVLFLKYKDSNLSRAGARRQRFYQLHQPHPLILIMDNKKAKSFLQADL